MSEIVVAKYAHSYYNRSSHFVREQYLKGRRFEFRIPTPVSRLSIASSSSSLPSLVESWSRSSSCSSVMSDSDEHYSPRRSNSTCSFDSDMPETPTFGAYENDPFVVLSDLNASSVAVPVQAASLKDGRAREKTAQPHVKVAGAAGNGYVVQEPRMVFSSLQQVARPSAHAGYNAQPLPANVRRFSG